MKLKNLNNKVAIITGSSRGIGKATAIAMSKQGAHVILNGRDKERLIKVENQIRDFGGVATNYCCDITEPENAKSLIDYSIGTFGKLDILVNNAGVSMRGNFADLNPEVFKQVFDINVLGAAYTSINAIPYIKETQGSMVFVSSIAGIRGLPSNSAYCSSKMALRAIAESIRIEEVSSNIHVGLIYVGITEIEKDKKAIGQDGSSIFLKDRSNFNVQSLNQVANSIIKNIKKRKFRTVLTKMGWFNSVLQPVVPDIVEKLLIYSDKRIKRRLA